MFTARFWFKSQKTGLRLVLLNKRKKAEISLGWHDETPESVEKAKSGIATNSNGELRKFLYEVSKKVVAVRQSLLENGGGDDLDVKEIKRLVKEALFSSDGSFSIPVELRVKRGVKGNFKATYLRFIGLHENPTTRRIYLHTLERMTQFDLEVNREKIENRTFEDISLGWIEDLERYLGRTAKRNSVNVHLRNIRAVFNYGIAHEVTDKYPFKRMKFKYEKTRKRAMSVEDLRKLFNCEVEPHIAIFRDMFKLIFMLIGINTVDLYRLNHIENGRIEFVRAKTHRPYSIKVEPEAMEIIQKYAGRDKLLNVSERWHDHRNFGQQINKALQRIGKVEIGKRGAKTFEPFWSEITTYWARHTWATIAAELDVPDAVISAALGHGPENPTTGIYIDRNIKKVDIANRKVLDYVLYNRENQEW